MLPKIKYPIGIQTFSEIVEENYLYVDKTAKAFELVSDNKYVFLSRPRRFGKSLLLSTLEAYFQGRKELFGGLALSRLEKEWRVHPVLRIDLSGSSYENTELLAANLNSILTKWESVFGKEESETTPALRFRGIIQRAYEQTGEKVVVLIDEYDKPILENIHDDSLHEIMKVQLRGFYSVIKECDQYLRFAMLTGVTKFGHLSVFSGLNNLNDISLDIRYNDICGITETEFRENFAESVKEFAAINGMNEDEVWEEFRKNYDGYLFSREGEGIYNPFSVMLAFSKQTFGRYWFSTGTPAFLAKLLRRYNFPLWKLEDQEQTGEELTDITEHGYKLGALLYQSGYLTIKGYDARLRRYRLGFPNLEVREGFWNSLYRHYIYHPETSEIFDPDSFVHDVMHGNPEEFMERLQGLLSSLSPGAGSREVHFQNILQIIFRMLGFRVQTEVRTSFGRADMVVQTPEFIYLFEFKINSSPQKAIEQIHEKGYGMPFKMDPRHLILIGANFSTTTSTIEDWLIEKQ